MEERDEELVLSSHALAALQEFLQEQQQVAEKSKAELDAYQEDWQLSQFWYSVDTQDALSRELLRQGGHIAIISAPSVFVHMQRNYLLTSDVPKMNENAPGNQSDTIAASYDGAIGSKIAKVTLFEFDQRFASVPMAENSDFYAYDYRNWEAIPKRFHHQYDTFLIDPPFLSEECFEKVKQAVDLLRRNDGIDTKFIVCSGAVMKETIGKLFGTKVAKFNPKHERGLSNEFYCYVNYTSEDPMFEGVQDQ